MPAMLLPEANADAIAINIADVSSDADDDSDMARWHDHLEDLYHTLECVELEIDNIHLTSFDDVKLARQIAFTASHIVRIAHRKSAAYIFKETNPNYDNSDRTLAFQSIDVHKLHVREAIRYTNDHLRMCKDAGVKRTEVICGKGLHSRGGDPKIKPALIDHFRAKGVIFSEHERNSGRLIVFIPTPNAEMEGTEFLA